MHKVLVNRLGGLSLPRKNVVRLTDRPDTTLDVYRGRKTTTQQQQQFCTGKLKITLPVKSSNFLNLNYVHTAEGCKLKPFALINIMTMVIRSYKS